MSDCGGGDSGGGGCDSSCAAPDSSDHRNSCHSNPSHGHCDSSHSSEDPHSTGHGSFNAGSISNNTPQWKSKGQYKMKSPTKNAEKQQKGCCCTLI